MMKNNNTVIISLTEERFKELIKQSLKEQLNDSNLNSLTESSPIMDSKEAAKFLKISLPTLHKWKMDGIIPFHKQGGRVLFIREHLAKCLSKE